MDSYYIKGGNRLRGEYAVQGSKNAALPILAASIATGCNSVLRNCPNINDVDIMLDIIRALGGKVKKESCEVIVDTKELSHNKVPAPLMKKIRSSVFLMGPLLARCGRAIICRSGGCAIGKRSIDMHIKALEKMGVVFQRDGEELICTASGLTGTKVQLDFPSVGVTENIMMAALGAEGETVIKNCAREPEIQDLQDYLNSCGAFVKGAGSGVITIKGKKKLVDTCHNIIPDRIEVGTVMAAAAVLKGDVLIRGARSDHLSAFIYYLRVAGCKIENGEEGLRIKGPVKLKSFGELATAPYPGFPTDLQPQMVVAATVAEGMTVIEENIFENRFKYVNELIKMGADIDICDKKAIIKGRDGLKSNTVRAEDLRGGAALTIAGLKAEGKTIIEDIGHIERGYGDFHKKLRNIGGEIYKNEKK